MILIAVSGGPDSIYLLNKYKTQNIIVAHVNYNMRETAILDQKLVENYCKEHNIKLQVLSLNSKDEYKGNFQAWARKKRYEFFAQVYKKNKCSQLLIAHHRDDSIATYFFQKKSKRKTILYGMQKQKKLFQMNVEKPLLNKSKKTIIKYLQKHNIQFNYDESNFSDKYERNKSNKFLEQHKFYKKLLFLEMKVKNFFKIWRYIKIKKDYNNWANNQFSLSRFIKLNNKPQLLTQFLNEGCNDIKLSREKLKSIVNFIVSKHNNNKTYKLNNFYKLCKLNNKLIIKFI